MKHYLVVLEKSENVWNAYVPDLPGCVAGADTREETEKLIYEAIELHLEDMKATGQAIPDPVSEGIMVMFPEKVA